MDESFQNEWALDIHHALYESVPDIRKLQPDAAKISDDADGNKVSLYWYQKCKAIVDPNCDLTQDTIYNDLANRVVFGYSLESKRKQDEENADVQATRLAHQLMCVIEASKTLERHQLNQQEDHADSLTQRPSIEKQREQSEGESGGDRGIVFSRSAQTDVDPLRISNINAKANTQRNNMIGVDSSLMINQVKCPMQKHVNCNVPVQIATTPFQTSVANVETSAAVDPKRHSPFIEKLLAKMKDIEVEDVSLEQTSNTISISCRRVREVFSPLVAGFLEAGSAFGIDISALVSLLNSHIKSVSETLTSELFTTTVISVATSLSECMLETMGGKDAVVQASALIYNYFAIDNDLSVDELCLFLRDLSTSGKSRISALFIGRLLERMGRKENKPGLQVVKAFIKSCQQDENVPLALFLKWLASLKPKFSATDMDDLLSDISCSQDATQVSMTRFMQICLPAHTCDAKDLKRKIASSTCINQVIELCKEKDIQETGIIEWREFLLVSLTSIT